MNLKGWITTNWFGLLICTALFISGAHTLAIGLFIVWELWNRKQD